MFHWPLILMGFHYGMDYWGAPYTGLLLFVLIILAPSAVFSWVTLRSGSVWPACIAHAANNAFFSLMIYLHNGPADMLVGPVPDGIIGFLGYVLLALPVFLIPGALASVDRAFSQKPAAVEQTGDYPILGSVT